MKRVFIFLTVVLVLNACSRTKETACTEIAFNTEFSAVVGQTYCLDDDNQFTITEIRNELCPCNIQCFWEGQYILVLDAVADGKSFKTQKGSSRNVPSILPFDEYDFKILEVLPEYTCVDAPQSAYKVRMVMTK